MIISAGEMFFRGGASSQDRFWDRCTLFDVNFQPKHMSVGELEAGLRWLFSEIYTDRELARRRRHYMEIVKTKTTPKELAVAR